MAMDVNQRKRNTAISVPFKSLGNMKQKKKQVHKYSDFGVRSSNYGRIILANVYYNFILGG